MAETTYAGPIPIPTPETKPYWEAAKQQKLVVQHCRDCGLNYFYPRPMCPGCLSRNVEWIESTGRGKLHTFVINHRASKKSPLPAPYVVAIVELEEGPKLMSNLVGVEPSPAAIRIDMPVEVVFEAITPDITLPRFRPVSQ